MRKVAKLMGISLLALGLAACDGNTKDTKAAPDGAAASAPAGQQVSLLDGNWRSPCRSAWRIRAASWVTVPTTCMFTQTALVSAR